MDITDGLRVKGVNWQKPINSSISRQMTSGNDPETPYQLLMTKCNMEEGLKNIDFGSDILYERPQLKCNENRFSSLVV